MNFNNKIPKEVIDTINKIEQYGFSAYIVGGCVRDLLMGVQPHDYDICTSAKPEDIINIFDRKNIIETGLKHGTVTVKGNDDLYEITTYRIETDYSDNRHPNQVLFVDNIEQDLSRRDFKFNAIAYHHKRGLIDPFNGKKDIENHIISCVGNANERFQEDALRILRCLRFASKMNFNIENKTSEALLKNRFLLKNISAERINDEFSKIIDNANKNILTDYKDIFAVFIPELKKTFHFYQYNPYHKYDIYEHMVESVIQNKSNNLNIKLALYLHDISKPKCFELDETGIGHFYGHAKESAKTTEKILKNLKYDNQTIKTTTNLIYYHDYNLNGTEKQCRKILNKFGENFTKNLIDVIESDMLAQSEYKQEEKKKKIQNSRNYIDKIIKEKQCFSLKSMKINGTDLKNMGIKEGKEIGEILNKLLNEIIDEKTENEYDKLIIRANEILTNKENNLISSVNKTNDFVIR